MLEYTWTSGDLEQKRQLQKLVFPSGIGYDKQNDRVQTKRVNSIFAATPLLTKDLAKIKSGEPVDFNQFSARVTSRGHSYFGKLNTVQHIERQGI